VRRRVKAISSKNAVDWFCALAVDALRVGVFPAVVTPFVRLLQVPYVRVAAIVATAFIARRMGGPPAGAERGVPHRDYGAAADGARRAGFGPDPPPEDRRGGAELIVLEGVSDAVWARIRQVVVEVHDVDNRLEVIKRMLAAKGFEKARRRKRGVGSAQTDETLDDFRVQIPLNWCRGVSTTHRIVEGGGVVIVESRQPHCCA
jgi:hypothetical protein